MADFIMDFLDWFEDAWNRFIETLLDALKTATVVLVAIITIPLWGLPFGYWLVFVKLREGEENAAD